MLVAKLRHKAERESREMDVALKDSRLSQQTSKTMDGEPQHPVMESTGGYVSPTIPKLISRHKQKDESCPHTEIIGDKCVANCRLCGIFIPKVRVTNH